jgi:hypothetical protein
MEYQGSHTPKAFYEFSVGLLPSEVVNLRTLPQVQTLSLKNPKPKALVSVGFEGQGSPVVAFEFRLSACRRRLSTSAVVCCELTPSFVSLPVSVSRPNLPSRPPPSPSLSSSLSSSLSPFLRLSAEQVQGGQHHASVVQVRINSFDRQIRHLPAL